MELVSKRIIDNPKRTAFLTYFHWLAFHEILYSRELEFIEK